MSPNHCYPGASMWIIINLLLQVLRFTDLLYLSHLSRFLDPCPHSDKDSIPLIKIQMWLTAISLLSSLVIFVTSVNTAANAMYSLSVMYDWFFTTSETTLMTRLRTCPDKCATKQWIANTGCPMDGSFKLIMVIFIQPKVSNLHHSNKFVIVTSDFSPADSDVFSAKVCFQEERWISVHFLLLKQCWNDAYSNFYLAVDDSYKVLQSFGHRSVFWLVNDTFQVF